MGRGRPGKGLGHVAGLEGPEATKERMRRIVQTLSGEMTVKEAARSLGISASRFAAMRQEVLQDWLDAMTPGSPGRPPKTEAPIEPSEVEALRKQVKELILDLQVANTRTELAITMPHVLKDAEKAGRKKGDPRRSGAMRSGGSATAGATREADDADDRGETTDGGGDVEGTPSGAGRGACHGGRGAAFGGDDLAAR